MRTDEKTVWRAELLVALFALIFLQSVANSELSASTRDTVTVCDGEDASFSWPCDLAYDLAKFVSLTFKGLSKKGRTLATIDSTGRLNVSEEYSGRVVARGTSGVRLGHVSMVDSGLYLTTASFANGTVIEREFTLTVQVPPLLIEDQLKVALHTPSPRCQNITCGRVLFPGFPALSLHWQTPGGSQSVDPAEGTSTVHGCPLSPGNYTCQVRGPALVCGKRFPHSAVAAASMSASMVLSAETVTVGTAKSAEQEHKELVLMIVVPIIAVMTPLVILGVWLLSHILSGSSCCVEDTEADLLASSALLPVKQGASAVTSSTPGTPDTAPSPDPLEEPGEEEVRSENEEEEGANSKGEEVVEAEDADLEVDTADPTVPLMDQETDPSIDLDDDGSESRL